MIQLVWSLLIAGHVALAVTWNVLMPGGFPASDREWMINEVAPLFIAAISVLALVSRGKLREALEPAYLAAVALFWMALGISARLSFPSSVVSSWKLPFFVGVGVAALWVRRFRVRLPRVWLVPVLAIPALWAGWAFPATQRSLPPATRPAGGALPTLAATTADPRLVRLAKDAQLHPDDGRLVVRLRDLVLTVQPLLSIESRSPDRFWTCFADPDDNHRTVRRLLATERSGQRYSFSYSDEDRSVLEASASESGIDLDARSRLRADVYSHLNQLTEITLRGHKKLRLGFSPLGDRRIEIPPPSMPSRFAYVDDAGVFHLADAHKQEKGPFTEVAAGPLRAGEPLVLSLWDGDQLAFRVTLDDWASQASTRRSPTAGWGVPENVIEMIRGGEGEDAAVLISTSPARTSVGRGFQSVGLGAGVYRDRVHVFIARAPTAKAR